ncbi:MAG: hypothetical protein U1B30_06785 [Pseudomonadota bacterium]|nr:hypothetical protein [Pseudomonadota bacterium]
MLIIVDVPDRMARSIAKLVSTGLWGRSVEEAVERLLATAIIYNIGYIIGAEHDPGD